MTLAKHVWFNVRFPLPIPFPVYLHVRIYCYTMRFLTYAFINVTLKRGKCRHSKKPHVYVYTYITFTAELLFVSKKNGKWPGRLRKTVELVGSNLLEVHVLIEVIYM